MRMTCLGSIAQIWRYPVKSMAGERLDVCAIGPGGLLGDRGWAVRDEQADEIHGAKQLPKLLLCAARYLEPPSGSAIPHVEITLPDDTTVRTDSGRADEALSTLLGRPVTLWPLQPPTDDVHYRRQQPLDTEREWRAFLTRDSDEDLPDLSDADPELVEEIVRFATPRGTYFDVSPFHLLTTASVAALAALVPDAAVDVRRFRPNLYIETPPDTDGFVEFEWSGSSIRIGDVPMTAGGPVPRCGMTAAAQNGLPTDPSILRTIVREVNQNLGIYASTEATGIVRTGDVVERV